MLGGYDSHTIRVANQVPSITLAPLAALSFCLPLAPFACSSGHGAGAFSGDPGTDAAAGAGHDADAGPTGSTSDGPGPAPDAAQTDQHVDAPALPPSSFDVARTFAGSYAALVSFRKVISLNGGALGGMHSLATFYMTMDLTADAARMQVTVAASDCHVDLTGTGTGGLAGGVLQIPDVVLTTTHLDPAVFSASTAGATTSWGISEVHGPIGWKWATASDAIPTSPSDSRIFDQDMDSNPGVTMHVLWNGTDTPLYFVQTQRDTLVGTVASTGDLTGTTTDATEQEVIGNTMALLNATVSWAPDPNTADNKVRLVRVPAPLTCAELMAQASTLFK
jgi:hypothetical protein